MKEPYQKPGRSRRKGISPVELMELVPNDEAVKRWLIGERWPDDNGCPHGQSTTITRRANRKPQPFNSRGCHRYFSVKTASVMHDFKLGLRVWVITLYRLTSSLKGVSSMQQARDLNVTQSKAKWVKS